MKDKASRRTFIKSGLQAGLALPFLGTSLSCDQKDAPEEGASGEAAGGLDILILGGTSFLGPHQIAYAVQRGHRITTFTRGKTQPTIYRELFEQVTPLIGDRSNDLTALENKTWDAVIDNSGHNAAWTRDSAALLSDQAGLYLYTSSTGVFYPYLGENIKEDAELLLVEPEGIEDEAMKTEYWYGVMKANSELEAEKAFGANRTIVVRPTYMIGPADKSNRFIHWPVRLAKGGEVMVPGKSEDPVQYMDVRDVAEFMIRLIEQKKAGTYNAAGPKNPQGIRSFVEEARQAFDAPSTLIQVDDYHFLQQQQVADLVPWIMPVGNNYGSARISNERAVQAGLQFRPLPGTVKDTYDWWYSDALSEAQRNEFELDPETVLMRERAILGAWKDFKKG